MSTEPLSSIATVIRSKNAGPYLLTFDVMFSSEADFQRVWGAGDFTRASLSRLFNVDESAVTSIFPVPQGHAIKFTLRRPLAQGAIGESDMYGCQQHAPLLDFGIHLKSA
jgi:hypothetical protein